MWRDHGCVSITCSFPRFCFIIHYTDCEITVGNSPQDLHRVGILDSSTPIVISHAAFLDARGAALLRSTNKHISITAESEMHYGHLHPTSHLIWTRLHLGWTRISPSRQTSLPKLGSGCSPRATACTRTPSIAGRFPHGTPSQ